MAIVDLTGFAYEQLARSLAALEQPPAPAINKDEPPGHGPVWACDEYGTPGHDYNTCLFCWDRCQLHRLGRLQAAA